MDWKEYGAMLLKADREIKKAPFGMGEKRKAKQSYDAYLKMVTGLVRNRGRDFPDKNISVYFTEGPKTFSDYLVDMFKETNNTAVIYMIGVTDQLKDAKTLGISDDQVVRDIKEAMKQGGVTPANTGTDGLISRPAMKSRLYPNLRAYHFMLQSEKRYKNTEAVK